MSFTIHKSTSGITILVLYTCIITLHNASAFSLSELSHVNHQQKINRDILFPGKFKYTSPSKSASFLHTTTSSIFSRSSSTLYSQKYEPNTIAEDNIKSKKSNVYPNSTEFSSESNNRSTSLKDADSSLWTKLQSFVQEKVLLGIEPTPDIIAIMTIYFVEGALGLARLAQTFLLKDTLHLGPAELSALTGLFTLPWTIKPLYGFLSDGVPLFGYRRRSYLILAGLLGGFSYACLGTNFGGIFDSNNIEMVSTLQASIGALTLSSACIAFSDVVADGIVVQKTRDADDPSIAGGLQSLCWGSASLGGLLSAYFSGSLIESIGPQGVFGLTAVLPLIVAGIALLIQEEPIGNSKIRKEGIVTNEANESVQSIQDQISALLSAIKNPSVWKPALFLFLWQSTPTGEGAFLYFMTNDLGFGPEFLGRVRLVTAAAGLVGVYVYQKYLRTVSIKSILLWSSILSTPLGLSQLLLISHANRDLGIPDAAFVFGDDVALSILGQIAFLPTLVLAARLCPPGVEAVLFATLMSIFNGASTVGTEVGAYLTKILGVTETNFDNLQLLTLICNLSSLLPLFLIGLLDDVGDKSEADLEEMDSNGV